MDIVQKRIMIGFETGDLENKSWEDIINEIATDTKEQLTNYKVPKNMIVNVILNFNKEKNGSDAIDKDF